MFPRLSQNTIRIVTGYTKIVAFEPGDAEVEQLCRALGQEKDVGRFDVPMHDSPFMGIRQTPAEVANMAGATVFAKTGHPPRGVVRNPRVMILVEVLSTCQVFSWRFGACACD